jgi:hypothetical protein
MLQKPSIGAIIGMLLRATRASIRPNSSQKDVEKTHVRDDSLLRGRGRPDGRERNFGAMPSSFKQANQPHTPLGSINHDACPNLSLE